MNEPNLQMNNVDLLRTKAYVKWVGNYSESAIRTKISKGIWRNGHEYIKGDGTGILLSIRGIESWARNQANIHTRAPEAETSKSTSDTRARFTSRL